MSTSTPAEAISAHSSPLFPVETEIYLLPDGQVIIADMPAELDQLVSALAVSTADAPNHPAHNVTERS